MEDSWKEAEYVNIGEPFSVLSQQVNAQCLQTMAELQKGNVAMRQFRAQLFDLPRRV